MSKITNDGFTLSDTIGINAAGVTGVRTPPIFHLQGSINALDPCNNCYIITMGGRGKGTTKAEDPLNILSVLTPMSGTGCL